MPRNLIIAGAGGLGAEAAWTAEASGNWSLLGFIDDDERRSTLGTSRQASARFTGAPDIWYFCAIGNNAARARMVQTLDAFGWHAATLAHPAALVAPSARIAAGAYLAAGAIIAPHAIIGAHAIVNMHVSIGHDAVLENFAHICPGARVSGNCRIGESAFLGSNAAILPGVEIGAGAVVGACAQVVQNVPPQTTVAGVPARIVHNPGPRPTRALASLAPGPQLLHLQTVFRDVFDDPALEVRPETCPATIPDWDSIAQVKLVLAVEESFGVRLQNEDLGSLRSAGDFLQALCRN